jgi:hypothetical protein
MRKTDSDPDSDPYSALTPREVSAALALMTAATEANTHIVGFTSTSANEAQWRQNTRLTRLTLAPSMRLDWAVQRSRTCRSAAPTRAADALRAGAPPATHLAMIMLFRPDTASRWLLWMRG